jgi:hypothetical protein
MPDWKIPIEGISVCVEEVTALIWTAEEKWWP